MKFHPATLIIVPIFLIDILLMNRLTWLGVTVPFVLLGLSRLMFYISPWRITVIGVVCGYVADVLVGVDRGALLVGYSAAGVCIACLRVWAGERGTLVSRQVFAAASSVAVYECVVFAFAPQHAWVSWMHYMAMVLLMVVVIFTFTASTERIVQRFMR